MDRTPQVAALSIALTLVTSPAIAAPVDPDLITGVTEVIAENYVFPDIGDKTALHIQELAASGRYDDADRTTVAARLTEDLQAFTSDRHFGVNALPDGWSPEPEDSPADREAPRPRGPLGVRSVERLSGNIGYLDLRGFLPAPFAESTIVAAVRILQDSSAVVLDLRRNGGGDPETVKILCSYFFDPAEPVHLNSLYFRPTDTTTEFWTDPDFPELAMPDTPVYILTSPYTFSGAEECAYNFQTRRRATIIGETTGGGAHPVNGYAVNDALMIRVPVGRAINPVTGTNWEGVGISPDIEIPADEALDEALRIALTELAEGGDEQARWGLYAMLMRRGGMAISDEQIASFAGDYTDRELRVEGGKLLYRRKGNQGWRPLVLVDADTFMIAGMDGFRLFFERDAEGRIVAARGLYQQGHTDLSPRSGG